MANRISNAQRKIVELSLMNGRYFHEHTWTSNVYRQGDERNVIVTVFLQTDYELISDVNLNTWRALKRLKLLVPFREYPDGNTYYVVDLWQWGDLTGRLLELDAKS